MINEEENPPVFIKEEESEQKEKNEQNDQYVSSNANSPLINGITAKSVLIEEKQIEPSGKNIPKENKSSKKAEEEDNSKYQLASTILNYIPTAAYCTGGLILSYILYQKFKI